MKIIGILLCLFFICNLQAQTLDLKDSSESSSIQTYKDSIRKDAKDKFIQKKNSSMDLHYKEYRSKLGKPKLGFDTIKRTTLLHENKHDTIKFFKSKSKYVWGAVKTKLPKGKQLFSFSGQVRSESFITTAQNPILRSELAYSRLYISPTITLLGLPFTSNFFFTTEANNTYKNNFFSFRLDVNALRQNAMQQIQKEIDEAKKLDRIRQVDLKKYQLETDKYEQELDALKKQLPSMDSMQDVIQSNAKSKLDNQMEAEKLKMEEKLKGMSDEKRKEYEKQFQDKKDSLHSVYVLETEDSLMRMKSHETGNIDTAKINKYNRLKSKLIALHAKKKEIEELRQMDSTKLLQKTQGIRDPDDLKKMAESQLPGKKLLQSVLSIDRFGIGLVNPLYSEFTLSNASIKGIDIGINKQNYFYDVTMGKTTKQVISPFLNSLPEYDRYIAVARMGYGELKKDFIAIEYLHAFDKDNIDPLIPKVNNGVINISARYTFLKQLLLEGNAAQSTYKESYLNTENRVVNGTSNASIGSEYMRAYQIKATQSIGKNAKVEAEVKQTGAGFRTVGNPFLRRNFRELELKYEQQLFKKKIKVSAFYKEMRDNLLEVNLATNRLKGYGVKLSTSFVKVPNLTLSYSPYQQGNNHPDSLYRTNNQFSILSAIITYKKRWKTLQWNSFCNFTRSAMEISGRGTVAYQIIGTMQTFQIGQRHTILLSAMKNTTAPSVDTLNAKSFQFSYNFLSSKKLSFGCLGEHTKYNSGSFKSGGGIQTTLNLLKRFSMGFLIRYDRINGLWNLRNEDVYTGRVVAMWRI